MKSIVLLSLLFLRVSQLPTEAQNSRKYSSCKLETSDFVEQLTFSFENNVLIIRDVGIKGTNQKFNFILDSGSEYTMISSQVANLIGLKTSLVEEITDGYDQEKIQMGLADLEIGQVVFHDVGVGVLDPVQIDKMCDIDGYIGYNLMKSCIWKIGVNEIIITDNLKNCQELGSFNKQKIYDGPTVEAGFENGFSSTMLFDLGDNGTVEIQESRIDLINDKEIATGVGMLYTTGLGTGAKDESSVHKLLKVPAFKFGGGLVKDMVVYTDSAPFFPVDIIGAGIIHYYDIILDFPKKRIYSQNTSDMYNQEDFTIHGFKCDFVENDLFISFVWNDSPASEAGLSVGQKIEKLNDLQINELISLPNCEKYVRIKPLISKNTITIVLADKDKTVTLTKAPLFSN